MTHKDNKLTTWSYCFFCLSVKRIWFGETEMTHHMSRRNHLFVRPLVLEIFTQILRPTSNLPSCLFSNSGSSWPAHFSSFLDLRFLRFSLSPKFSTDSFLALSSHTEALLPLQLKRPCSATDFSFLFFEFPYYTVISSRT